jgi:hypothetical protein
MPSKKLRVRKKQQIISARLTHRNKSIIYGIKSTIFELFHTGLACFQIHYATKKRG